MSSNDDPVRRVRLHTWRRVLSGTFVALLVMLPCCGVPSFCLSYQRLLMWWNRVPFDSEAWKAENNWSGRYDMTYDLLYGDRLVGKTADEVTELLGPSLPPDKEVVCTNTTPIQVEVIETWYYYLGAHDKYSFRLKLGNTFLAVEFRGGKVTRVWKFYS